MLRKLLPRTVLIMVLGTISGCGTAMNMFGIMDDFAPPLYPFGGTIIDTTYVFRNGSGYDGMGIVLGMDIPFSMVADVAMLPITVPYTLLKQEDVDPRFQIEKLEPTQEGEERPAIDDDLHQKLNNATEPWTEAVSKSRGRWADQIDVPHRRNGPRGGPYDMPK